MVDARRAVPVADRHQHRQHDPQRGAALDRREPRVPAARSCSCSSTATRSCSPACCSPPARSATSSAARASSPLGLALFGAVLRVGRLQPVGRHADRRPGADGHRRRVHLPEHAVDPHQHVPRRPRAGRAIGIWAGVSGLGVAIGPLAGGLLRRALLVGLGLPRQRADLRPRHRRRSLPRADDDARPRARPRPGRGDPVDRRPDGPAVRHHRGARSRWIADPTVLVSFVVGLVFLAGFAWWETHSEHPMLDLHFFQNPRFSAASATITLTFFALYGSTFLLTQYFQFVLEYSPLKAGRPDRAGGRRDHGHAPRRRPSWWSGSAPSWWSSPVCRSWPLGLLMYSVEPVMSSLDRRRRWCGCCSASAWGWSIAPATESIMGSLPKAKAGVGSAVNDTTRQTGGALGVAIIGSVFAATLPPCDHGACRPPGRGRADGARLDRLRARRRHPLRPAAAVLAESVHDAASRRLLPRHAGGGLGRYRRRRSAR